MSKKQRFMRLAAALGVATLISSQIPMQGGVALARDGYPNSGGKFLGTSLTNEQVFTGAALGLLGASLIRSLRDKGETTTTTTTSGTGGTPVAGTKDCPAATLVGDGSKSIYDTLAGAPNNYSAIKGLVDDSGIADSLKNEGPFTLIAPNNTALGAVPPATVSALRSDKAKLAELLQTHTLIGRYKYEDLCTMADGKNILTLSGNTVKVTHKDGEVFLNGVQVMPVDMSCSNGYVHPLGGLIK
ncbi:MAG: fasciclin domain-containing protein [Armatimonas sp.]